MLDNLLARIDAIFGTLLDVTSAGGVAIFDICVTVALVFIIFAIIKALAVGGGAILQTVALRLFILFGLQALVIGWPVLAHGIHDDIMAFAAHVTRTDALTPGNFTPSGILATNDALTAAIYNVGAGNPFEVLSAMTLWKIVAIALIQFGDLFLALDLFVGDISLDVVVAGCAVLIGFVVSPWFNSFTMQYVGLIIGTAVYIVLIGVFVAVGQAIATADLNIMNDLRGVAMPGVAMLEMGSVSFLFGVLACIFPAAVASKITGGAPIMQAKNLVSAGLRGKAALGL